ncbi:MAG: hypothetical protein ACFFEE_04390, partial [Candidatus Thorarchaeota archaeon]
AIPYIGYITLVLQEPGVLPLVIVLLIVIIVLPEFWPKKESEMDVKPDSESEEDSDAHTA